MFSYLFKKKERIRKRSEYLQILREGKRYKTKHFKIIIKYNYTDKIRLGLIVSKKAGKAVKRNRIKRLLREFFRLNKNFFPISSDILFIARPGDDDLNYWIVYKELKEFFLQNHVFPKGSQKNYKSVC